MNAFLYSVGLQWKIDLRNKSVVICYYVVPLVFFLFMGGIFTTINPDSQKTLIESMTVFAVTMGAVIGTPVTLAEIYGSDIKKAYQVGNIPLWSAVLINFISAFIHLFLSNLLILVLAPILFKASMPQNFIAFWLKEFLLIASSLSIGSVLGIYIKAISKLTMAGQLIFLPSIMISGIMFPITMLPEVVAQIGQFFPASAGFALLVSSEILWMPIFVCLGVILLCLILIVIQLQKMQAE